MTESEAKALLKKRMGNDYFFLPVEAEAKWIEQIIEGSFFKSALRSEKNVCPAAT